MAEPSGEEVSVDAAWAMQAGRYAEVYEQLLQATRSPQGLALTKLDDEIYRHFKEVFPGFHLQKIDEERIKAAEEKAKWSEFAAKYEGQVKDYNLGSLIRLDAHESLSEHNAFLGIRMQFYAIEIARNREGVNDAFVKKLHEHL